MLSAFISDSRNRVLRLTFVKVIPDIAIVTATTTTGTKITFIVSSGTY